MFEIVYKEINKNLMNFECHGCNGNTTGYKGICPDLKLMFKNRKDGSYNEQYNCNGKAMAFVKKYGSSYISEIYHYLETANILEQYNNNNLNILVLGCGFDPWYYAVTKYIHNKKLKINFSYTGYDKSQNWDCTRPVLKNTFHYCIDLTNPLQINFNNYDFVIVDKVFSTIQKMDLSCKKTDIFLNNIVNNFKKVDNNRRHFLIFREQAVKKNLDRFEFTVNNSINWENIDYFYLQGRENENLRYITNCYMEQEKSLYIILNKDNIYGSPYNNYYKNIAFNSFFIQYSI